MRKAILSFVEPPGILILIFLALARGASRRRRLLFILLSAGVYIASCEAFVDFLSRPLLVPPGKVSTEFPIVLLGGGAVRFGSKELPSCIALLRAAKAVEVWKKVKTTVVICGGNPPGFVKSEAQMLKEILAKMGVPPSCIIVEDRSKTTEENAKFAAQILGKLKARGVYLVTSPLHMRRSIRLFERFFGGEIVPIPSVGMINMFAHSWKDFLPSSSGFFAFCQLVHEALGNMYYGVFRR